MANFSAQVSDIVRRSQLKLDAVVKGSLQDIVNEANTPVAKGGKMRVDTGFLRASGQMSLTGMPTGPSRGDPNAGKDSYAPADANIALTLAGVEIGNTVYFGWTAVYAAARESKDGFLESAVQNWQKIVDANVRKVGG